MFLFFFYNSYIYIQNISELEKKDYLIEPNTIIFLEAKLPNH